MRVLGIDPSSRSTGFGIVEFEDDAYSVLAQGVIKPSKNLPLQERLNTIRARLEELIAAHSPDETAIENPFYARNIKTAITLGQVRGAVLVAVASSRLPLFEYSALEIKKALTGFGQAEKQQVGEMVKTLLGWTEGPLEEDASDALAAAVCHIHARLFQLRVEEAGL